MATEFSGLLAANIIHICFGEDLSTEQIKLQVPENGLWVFKTYSIKQCIYVIINQILTDFYKNVRHPVNWLYLWVEKVFWISNDSKRVKENCLICRDWIKKYIMERKEGKRRSTLTDNTDILSLMLSRPDVFTDDFMVDELLGFFGAAVDTTHNVT